MQRAVEPRGPITIQFGSCVAEKTFGYRTLSGEHGVLYAQSGKRYVLYSTVSYREMIQDQADGLLRPGDMLTVMWYPWWDDSIAAVSSQTKEYGSMEAFENGVRDVKPIFYSVSILVGLWLVFCLLYFWSFHSKFSEIRSLRRKYLEQIKERNSGVSP